MSRQMTIFRVFVSSPNDISSDRQVAKSAILEASEILSTNGVILEPWLWEEKTITEFGKPPQEIIKGQLDQYDVYIGLMGATFGTPTANYGSGTEEEFYDATNAFEQGNLKHLGFFFKDVSIQIKSIDANQLMQLQKVAEYKARLQKSGIYQDFKDGSDLKGKIVQLLLTAFKDESKGIGKINEGVTTSDLHNLEISSSFKMDFLNAFDKSLVGGESSIALEDLWVDIDISASESDANGKVRKVNSNTARISGQTIVGKCTHILGGETSGKTTICKVLFQLLHAAGFIPVFLSGKRIKTVNREDFKNKVAQAISEQYLGLSQRQAKNILAKKIIVIIDDFDQISLNAKNSLNLLSWIKETYFSAVITTAVAYRFAVLEATKEVSILGEFLQAEISELGQKKRYELIEKWCAAKNHESLPEEQVRYTIENKRGVINRILITHIVPRTPMIVLILLQATDSGQTSDLARSGYVRYYKYLIDSVILKNLRIDEAEQAYALLPELAWATYNSKDKELTVDEAERVVDSFAVRRALRKSALFVVLDKMKQIGIFDGGLNVYRIKQTYVYNFFLADYISQNLQNQTMAEHVRALCQNAWSRQTANILIFLSFHTDSKIIIESLVESLNSSYPDAAQFEFSRENTEIINKLIEEVPRQIVDESAAKERRDIRLDTHDLIDSSERYANDENPDSLLGEMDRVFMAVEILGHILRNHYARIDAEPKQEMLEAASSAILRCIGNMLERLSVSVDTIVNIIQSALDRVESKLNPDHKEKNKDIREKIARQVVFLLTTGFIIHCGKKLTRAVGDENLEITYTQVLSETSHITKKYLDAIIKLDCFQNFPLKEVKEVSEMLKKDHIGKAALRFAVAERLDMRPPANSSDFKKYCDLVGLEVKSRLVERQRLGSQPEKEAKS